MGTNRPMESSISPMRLTLPETPEWIAAETNPPASATGWPTFTRSPAFTRGFAGAPMCMVMGSTISGGTGIRSGTQSAVCFRWGTRMLFNSNPTLFLSLSSRPRRSAGRFSPGILIL